MVADSVDYYEHKTGKRTEGVAYAVLSFSIKVTLALGAAVCLAVIFSDMVGYSATATDFTFETKRGVYFAYTVIPGITSLLAAIPILKYDLVGAKKKAINDELRARRGESADAPSVELAEAAAMETYLPKQLSEEETEAELKKIIAETGASKMADMGKVMGIATKRLAGQADGKLISAIVRKLLG